MVADRENRKLRSVRKAYPWPSVIRLNSYVHLPYQRIILTRKNILKRDGHKCMYCGRSDLTLTIDHIIPRARGGEDTWENLAAACLRCNNKKGDRTPDEAKMPLIRKPYTPNHIMFIKSNVNRLEDNWKPFLFEA